MPRAQRFPDSLQQALQCLLLSIMPHITIRHAEIPEEARCINLSLANFIKVSHDPPAPTARRLVPQPAPSPPPPALARSSG